MPRKSAAALAIVEPRIRCADTRLLPPDGLTGAALDLWRATVEALPPEWFRAEQAPLLERYCRHVVRARQLETLIAETDPMTPAYARLVSLAGAETARILALARAARLPQQSRLRAETAHSAAAKHQPTRTIDVLLQRGEG